MCSYVHLNVKKEKFLLNMAIVVINKVRVIHHKVLCLVLWCGRQD